MSQLAESLADKDFKGESVDTSGGRKGNESIITKRGK